jgi:hypothetical protein
MKKLRLALAVATTVAVVMVAGQVAGDAAPSTPRWVLHVKKFPGGISNGVRATLDRELQEAQRKYGSSPRTVHGSTDASGALVNVQANTDTDPPLPQNETAVAYNPSNPLHAVAASNDYVNGGLWVGTTHDGGNTWSSQFLQPRVHFTGDFCTGGDPTVVYSTRDQAFYAASLCFFRAHPESELSVIRSTDNGDHWTGGRYSSMVVSNIDSEGNVDESLFYDKELLAVDNNVTSPFYGRLYMTYVKFHILEDGTSDYCPVQIGFTDDIDPSGDGDLRDAVWTNVGVTPDDPGSGGLGESANQWAVPVIDDQGGVDIAYAIEECNTSIDHGLRFKRSTDGGATWPATAEVVDKPGQFADNPDPGDLLPPKNARVPISLSIAFNPVGKALGLVYQNNVNAARSGADISFQRSGNYGQTWSNARPVSVNAAGRPARNDQFFPWIQADPGTPGWRVIFFDNRLDPDNLLISTVKATSATGSSWIGNELISTAQWDPNQGFFSTGSFFGDYNGYAVAPGGIEYPVWTDGRNTPGVPLGQTDIFTVPNS